MFSLTYFPFGVRSLGNNKHNNKYQTSRDFRKKKELHLLIHIASIVGYVHAIETLRMFAHHEISKKISHKLKPIPVSVHFEASLLTKKANNFFARHGKRCI